MRHLRIRYVPHELTAGMPVEIPDAPQNAKGRPMNAENATNAINMPANAENIANAEIPANPEWLAFLKRRGAHEKDAQILDFGHPDEEQAAARNDGALLVPLTHLALIGCTGEDAQNFLQNQTTNDVVRLPVDGAQHSAWCSPKGRMLASLILYRQDAGFRALLAADLSTSTLVGLQKYILRSKVQLDALSDNHVMLGLAGMQAKAALHAASLTPPARPMATTADAIATVIRLADIPVGNQMSPRYIIITGNAAAPTLFDALAEKARPTGTLAWHSLDVRAGIALITAVTRDEFVPQMLAFDKIGGISFTKGCYPGQEIVARAHYLGKVKRNLYRLHSKAPLAAGEAIYSTDSLEACGIVVQAAPELGEPDASRHIALAVIKDSAAQATLSGSTALSVADSVIIGNALEDVFRPKKQGSVHDS